MKQEIIGIIQWWDNGRKRTQVVYKTENSPIRRAVELPDDTTVSTGRIVSETAKDAGTKSSDIIVPDHVIIKDITEVTK